MQNFGQKVKLKNSDDETVITDIMWHSTNQEHYYFLIVNSKKKSIRYLESEYLFAPQVLMATPGNF